MMYNNLQIVISNVQSVTTQYKGHYRSSLHVKATCLINNIVLLYCHTCNKTEGQEKDEMKNNSTFTDYLKEGILTYSMMLYNYVYQVFGKH